MSNLQKKQLYRSRCCSTTSRNKNIRRMMQFSQTFPNFEIVSPLVSQCEIKERLANQKFLVEDKNQWPTTMRLPNTNITATCC